MRQRTALRLYALHSWTGVVLGLLVFVLCFSGSVALFYDELHQWEHPEHRTALDENDYDVDGIVRHALASHPAAKPSAIYLTLPVEAKPLLDIRFYETGADQRRKLVRLHYDVTTGRELQIHGENLGRFLRNLHTDLHLPNPIGRYLAGLLGIVMLLSIVSGVILHRKILANLFVFRVHRSTQLKWSDAHNVIGTWGLPFHIMIAFTGALLGLSTLLLSVLALFNFQGDVQAARQLLAGTPPRAVGHAVPMTNLDSILDDARARRGSRLEYATILNWGDENAYISVQARADDSLDASPEHRYWLRDGSWDETWSLGRSVGGRMYAAITPLHYATYGGLSLKILYAFLGFAASALVVTGIRVWTQRRASRLPEHARSPHRLLLKATGGISAGMVLATLCAFYANKILPTEGEQVFAIGAVYFLGWLAALVCCLVSTDVGRGVRLVLGTSALLAMGAPAVNALTTGQGLFIRTASTNWWVDGADLALLVVGLGLLLGLYCSRLPNSPPEC